MPRETQEDSPHRSLHRSWPQEFTIRRIFDRNAENQPYIDWLEQRFSDGDGVEDGEEEDGEDVVDLVDGNDDEGEDEVDGQGEGDESKTENREDGKNTKPRNRRGIVRSFMGGMTGEEDFLPYCDQIDVVAGFVEQATSIESENPVALLDDRQYCGPISVNKKHRRSYQGPLTSQKLREELSKERFKTKSEKDVAPRRSEDKESNIDRRVLFVPNLGPSTIEAIFATAPRNHALALKDFFYRYLKGKTSIGVTIPSLGYKIFTLDFHINYYVLKKSTHLFEDARKGFHGKPLRQSWELPFLSGTSTTTPGIHRLYEAQIGVIVTGIDNWVWTAYGTVDTYFGSKENIDAYHQMKSRTGLPDPLTAGWLPTNNLIRTPREYFFKVLEIRMIVVRREWNLIIDEIHGDIKQSRENHKLPLIFIDPSTRQELREISERNTQMVRLLRQLIGCLSETVDSWDIFQQKDKWYFLDDGDSSANSSFLIAVFDAVDRAFLDLKGILKKLEHMEGKLCQDNPQGLNAHYNHGNHEAQIFQQKSARHIQILTVITIAYLPLALAAAMFSTQGVLPFTPNLARFTYVLFIFGILVIVSIIALFKWRLWFQLIIECLERLVSPSSGMLRRLRAGTPGKDDLEQG